MSPLFQRLPFKWQRRYELAMQFVCAGRWSDAAEAFEAVARVAAYRPVGRRTADWDSLREEFRIYCLMAAARCLMEARTFGPALRVLRKAGRLSPGHPMATVVFASAQRLQGRVGAARRILEVCVASHPDCTEAWSELCCCHLEERRFDDALAAACRMEIEEDEDVRQMRSDAPIASLLQTIGRSESPGRHCRLAALLFRNRFWLENAVAVLEYAVERGCQDPETLELLCEVLLEAGDYQRVTEIGKRLLRLNPQNGAARDALGVAFMYLGRINEALRMADQLVHMQPTNPSNHFKKAVLFQHGGMYREAIESYDRVFEMSPESEIGQEARRALTDLDWQQLRQIFLLVAEDPVFRAKLQRDSGAALQERGFHLSAAGRTEIDRLDFEIFSSGPYPCRPALYH